jgi:hypothetical protein
MKNCIYAFVLIQILIGCNSNRLNQDQLNTEKDVIRARIESFLIAYKAEDLNTMLPMLSSSKNFLFFGSDLAEINRSKSDFQNQLVQDWKLFDSIEFGELRNVDIAISKSGDFANTLFEVPMKVMINKVPSSFTMRFDLSFVEEDGVWKIKQGLVYVPSVGQSSAELVQSKELKK